MSKPIDWVAEVAAWRASGMTARKFSEERGYTAARLYWWSSQLKRSDGATRKVAVPIARVVRKRPAESRGASAPIVIQVGSVRVEVTGGADRDTLSAVLQTLAGTSWGAQS